MTVILNVPLQDVLIDQNILPNIRGEVRNTADLQAAMGQGNFLEQFPIKVIRHPDKEGKYLSWDGARRLTAARMIGLEEVTVLVSDITPAEALQRQLSVLLSKDQPVVVLNKNNQVVAGICWAVHQLTEAERLSNVSVAQSMGEKPDTISAYRSLFDEPLAEMKQRVANGDIGITVYSRLKHQSEEVKLAVLRKSGTISRAYVDNMLRSLKSGGLRSVEETETAVDYSGKPETVRFDNKGVNVTAVLQRVKGLLRAAVGYDLKEVDYLILDEIGELLGEFI